MNTQELSSLRKQLNLYFILLQKYQDAGNNDVCMEFDKGYWLSKNENLAHYENTFLKRVNTNSYLENFLQTQHISQKTISDILCLLGWSKNIENAGKVLESYLTHQSVAIANSAARALFPYVATGKYIPKKDHVTYLLHRKSKFAKNKALGLIAFLPDDIFTQWLDEALIADIQKLSKHNDRYIIGNIATIACNRIHSKEYYHA